MYQDVFEGGFVVELYVIDQCGAVGGSISKCVVCHKAACSWPAVWLPRADDVSSQSQRSLPREGSKVVPMAGAAVVAVEHQVYIFPVLRIEANRFVQKI
jgi:hypothetical protein